VPSTSAVLRAFRPDLASQSGAERATVPAARRIGSNLRTRRRRRFVGRRKRIGGGGGDRLLFGVCLCSVQYQRSAFEGYAKLSQSPDIQRSRLLLTKSGTEFFCKLATSFERACNTILLLCNDLLALALQCRPPWHTGGRTSKRRDRSCVANHTDAHICWNSAGWPGLDRAGEDCVAYRPRPLDPLAGLPHCRGAYKPP
jgi:hypothetical protein